MVLYKRLVRYLIRVTGWSQDLHKGHQ